MSVVDDIKSRLDILDVVSDYAPIQRSGRSYKAVCPFHTEKTPSFFVFPDRQSWRCFGACAMGGDMFSFVMRIENLDFSETLKRLAHQAGINLPERKGRERQNDILHQVNDSAGGFFRKLLLGREGSKARDYLRMRGLSQDAIEKFQLGFSPRDGESLKRFLLSQGYAEEQLAIAGVVTRGQGGDTYRDMFWGRLMFPIWDAEGRLAGFGGRALGDAQPKYLNSPRSPVFDKSNILYALNLAKGAIGESGIVIVEGYMDAIAAHQHGFSNVVASMGTALTEQQVSLVCGLVRRAGPSGSAQVVLALDPDTAGQEATLRSLESSWKVFHASPRARSHGTSLYERLEVPSLKIAPLPQGKDPDEIIRESPEVWATLVGSAEPVMDYLFTALSSRLDLSVPQGKSRLAELLFPLVAATPDPFQQDFYFQRLASLLGVSEATLQASLGKPRPSAGRRQDRSAGSRRNRESRTGWETSQGREGTATPFARLDHDPLEEYCLALLIRTPELVASASTPAPDGAGGDQEPADDLRLEHFQRVENREVFTNWMKCSILEVLRENLDEDLKGHLDHLLGKALPPSDLKQQSMDFRYCVRRLEERFLRDLNRQEEVRLSQAEPEEVQEQEQRILQVGERLKHIFAE